MDGSPTPPTPPAAGTPYREGKPLAEIIPPDRRQLKTAALVLTSMVAGVALWTLGGSLLDMIRALDEPVVASPVVTPGYVAGRITPSVLHGPGGSFAMPPRTRTVVHVWLQGCADCMPAFEAMSRLHDQGGASFDAPIINVAYGEADPTWAQRYGVAQNLFFDPGGVAVVRPLGIGSFTTLVVEPSGAVIHRDRPDRAGYIERMRNAILTGDPSTPAPRPTSDPLNAPGDGTRLDQAGVERVVAAHRTGLKLACWERAGSDGPSSASVVVSLTIAPDGHVDASSASGDDPALTRCIEAHMGSWVFPAPGTTTTVKIPIKLVRE